MVIPNFYPERITQKFYPKPEDIPSEKYAIELWFPLTENQVPGIIPNRYIISTFGYVYDMARQYMYPSENVHSDYYVFCDIRLIDGTKIHTNNHMLAMKRFKPFKPVGKIEIDHINGKKYQNWIWNLDYVTHQENLIRAVNTGLYPVGENQQNAIYTDEQIGKICELIQAGYSPQVIQEKLKDELPNLGRHIINDIKSGRQWRSVSKNYDFSNKFEKPSSKPFTIEEVELFCSGIEKYGYDLSPREIAKAVGVDMDNLTEFEQNRHINCISRLRRKLIFKDICAKYNF